MKSVRVLFLFVVVCAFAGTAEACLSCYVTMPGSTFGTCELSMDGYCTSDCCGAFPGDLCRVPDFLWSCWPAAPPVSVVQKRQVPRISPSTYFSSRQPLEHAHRRLVARTRKCAAAVNASV